MYQQDEHQSAERGTLSISPKPTSLLGAVVGKKGPALGLALTIPSIVVAQVVGQKPYDFVLIDMEHSPLSPELMTQMVHAVVHSSNGTCFPLVRVPSSAVEWIKWALDSGAAGIVVPMINNRKEMEEVVERALYSPRGKRSFGPSRSPWGLVDGVHGGVGTYFQRALDGDIAILPMIESAEGVENAADILSVNGASGVFIGPIDLRLSLGLSGVDGSEPIYMSSLNRIFHAAKGHNKIVGTLGMGSSMVSKRVQEGVDFLVVAADMAVLAEGVENRLSEAALLVSKHESRPSL